MVTNRELKYRTLQEVIDAASIDLSSYFIENEIETAELIPIIQEINWELGIQIQQTKETVLDIANGRTKLPNDFDFLNFGFICSQYTQYYTTQSLTQYEVPFPIPQPNVATCPCWTVTSLGAQCPVIACNGTQSTVFFPANEDGTAKTTKVCAILVDVDHAVGNSITAATFTNCLQDNNNQFTCNPQPDCGCSSPLVNGCTLPNPDPWNQSKVYTICNDTVGIRVIQPLQTQVLHYSFQQPLYLQPSRTASAFCSNSNMKSCAVNGFLRDGFIVTPNLNCGTIYINYQGILEDDNGNLLAIDHPKLNQYYNYAVKERILENQYLNGAPDIERRLQLVQQKKQQYKGEAMVLAYTPDFRTMCNAFTRLRQVENEQHVLPFSRYTGVNAFTSWVDRWVNGRFRDS